MSLHGTINHVALSVTDLDAAMQFYGPILQALGYTVGEIMPYGDRRLVVNVHEQHGTAINVWQGSGGHAFDVYEPGLHHLAFNVDSRAAVDRLAALLVDLGATMLEGPSEFPFAHHGYYAVYCLDPDGVKLEFVYMAGLPRAIAAGSASSA